MRPDPATEVTLFAEDPNGYLVIEVRRRDGRPPAFSIGADLYATKAAFEAGNSGAIIACGCLHEEILAACPELKPLVDLHLANSETGEPMHGASNGWYFMSPSGAMAHEIDYRVKHGRSNYSNAPEPFDVDPIYSGRYSEEFLFWFWARAAEALRCTIEELPLSLIVQEGGKREFETWVDENLRDRWKREAEWCHHWIDSHANEPEIPAEQTYEEEFVLELDGLYARGVQDGERDADYVSYPASNYRYVVTVRANEHEHEFEFFGSIADYQDGVVNAREAVFGILQELASYEYESAEEKIQSYGMDPEEDVEMIAQMREVERKADELMPGLSANLEVIG